VSGPLPHESTQALTPQLTADLGPLAAAVAAGHVRSLDAHRRLVAKDFSLWPGGAAANAAWIGWMDSLERAPEHLDRIARLALEVRANGVTDVVLTGMGGSSLFPEVLSRAFGVSAGHPRLWVIDSTDPAAVLRIEDEVPWSSTVVVAASKSGGTVETRAHLARFLDRLSDVHGVDAGRSVIVVTDPGSSLESFAEAERFLGIVSGDADVGGRFSALSPFGLLPAALLGVDVVGLLERARSAEELFTRDPWTAGGPAMLAEVLAAAHATDRFALHLILPEDAGGFGAWIEQLVAESSGKSGKGMLPIVSHSALDVRGDERRVAVAVGRSSGLERLTAAGVPVLVLPWEGPRALGAETLRWMQAVALLCARIGVDPFDQPDVAAAKAATAAALATPAPLEAPLTLQEVLDGLDGTTYLAVLAFIDPSSTIAADLQDACALLARELDIPVTFGVGPRYLHSTGQFHKGGRPGGRFAIVVGADPNDADVPGEAYSFSRLKLAQAMGDLAALRAEGRRADIVELSTFLQR